VVELVASVCGDVQFFITVVVIVTDSDTHAVANAF
jgi:hypothetical protein